MEVTRSRPECNRSNEAGRKSAERDPRDRSPKYNGIFRNCGQVAGGRCQGERRTLTAFNIALDIASHSDQGCVPQTRFSIDVLIPVTLPYRLLSSRVKRLTSQGGELLRTDCSPFT